MRITSAGHAVFAATLIVLGVLGLVQGNFAPAWRPVPHGVPARELLAHLCALVSLACGIGLLSRRTAATAAGVLLGYLLLWFVSFRVTGVIRAPAAQDSWSGAGETLVYVAGAWVLHARFATRRGRERLAFAAGESGMRIAKRLYGLALVPFGVAHFTDLRETASLVPAWLPAHVALAYLTGSAFLAAALAIIVGWQARWAATLSTLQMGLFTLLVWAPIVAAGPDPLQWSEFVISWTLTAGAWVVADSCRDDARPSVS